MADVSIGQQNPAAAYIKSLWFRNDFHYFLQPETLLWYFHHSAACTAPASPDLFHAAAALIWAHIYCVYVAMYQVSGLECSIGFYFRVCADTQNRSTRTKFKIANVFFHRLTGSASERMASVHSVSTS